MPKPGNADPNDPEQPGGAKPWLRWNGEWFSRFSQGSNLTYTDASGNTRNTEVLQAHDGHKDVVYMSGRNSRYKTVNGASQYAPHTYVLPSDAASFSRSEIETAPPKIDKIYCDGEEKVPQGDKPSGVPTNRAVSYLFIPVNSRGSAGPWAYFSYAPEQDYKGRDFTDMFIPTIVVNSSSNTSYVEVYRTREWEQGSGFVTPPKDMSWYFLERISTGRTFKDDNSLKYEYTSGDEANANLPAKTLDREINAWAYETINYNKTGSEASDKTYTANFGSVKHLGANALFMSGRSRMVYGGVQWPTKPVQFAILLRNQKNTSNGRSFQFAHEYDASGNQKKYGYETQVYNHTSATPVWQGEQALVVWDENGNDYSRSTVDGQGLYDIGLGGLFDRLSEADQEAFLTEDNVALLSERFRPLEVSLETQFQVPSGQTIRAIEPARLAEEESITTYSMYVLTDEAVFTANIKEEQTALRKVNTIGVDQYRVDFLSGSRQEYEYPLVAPTKYGLTYIGTDGRVYILNGRKFQEIDKAVPNIWYSDLAQPVVSDAQFSTIYNEYSDVWAQQTTDHESGNTVEYKSLTPYDIGYDQERDELMVVTFDNVWIYEFDQKEWVGNYKREDAVSVQYLDYHDSMMVHRYDRDQSGDVYELLNEDGPPIEDNAVVTNPVLRSPEETKVRETKTDYDPLFVDNTASWLSEGDTQVTLQKSAQDDSVGVFDTDGSHLYSTVMIQDGKDGANLTTLIKNIASSTTATLADALGPAENSPAPIRWFIPVTIRQEVASEYHSVYGGTDLENSGLVRRSEQKYHAHPRRRKFPRVNGSGHVIRIENFKSFKSMMLTLEDSDL